MSCLGKQAVTDCLKHLANDFAKGQRTYPKTRQENLKLMDASNKFTAKCDPGSGSYGGSFAQQKGEGGNQGKGNGNQKGKPKFDLELWSGKCCHRCGKDGHPAWAKVCKEEDVKKHKAAKAKDKGNDNDEELTKAKAELKKTKQTMVNMKAEMDALKKEDDDDDDQDASFGFVNVGHSPAMEKLIAHVHHTKGRSKGLSLIHI